MQTAAPLTRPGRLRAVAALPCAAVVAALAFTAPASATTVNPAPPTVSPTTAAPQPTQGIIMRDGGVCDPIRHMGC